MTDNIPFTPVLAADLACPTCGHVARDANPDDY